MDQSEAAQWRHVDTSLNPADDTSRGTTIDDLLNSERWTQGPQFLRQSEKTWPQGPADLGRIPDDDPEVKKKVEVFANQQTHQSDHIDRALGKFSSWTCLKKIIAWTLRYIKNIRKQIQRRGVKNETVSYQSSLTEITPLSVNEIKEAETAIIKYVQKRGFEGELISFNNASKQEQERSSRIKKCSSI